MRGLRVSSSSISCEERDRERERERAFLGPISFIFFKTPRISFWIKNIVYKAQGLLSLGVYDSIVPRKP